MSRITGTDAKEMMEAYNAVYAPQELTEEQVWEEVENWVNSLLEEGYDLSEYTWEEMYESYLSEAPAVPSVPSMDQMVKKGLENQKLNQAFSRSSTQLLGQPGQKPPATTSAPRRDVVVQAAKGGVPGTLNKTTGKWTASASSTPAARTSAPTATPAARTPAGTPPGGKVAPTKPAAPAKPATGILGKTSFERRTPTSAELKAAQAARAGGEKSPEKVLQAAKAASAPSPARSGFGVSAAPIAAKASVSTATAPEVKATNTAAAKTTPTPVAPKPNLQQSIRANRLMSSFDPFDVIKGHLIDEGYADTEEAALKIMANMSESWKNSIIG